jgi:hypothetical protein
MPSVSVRKSYQLHREDPMECTIWNHHKVWVCGSRWSNTSYSFSPGGMLRWVQLKSRLDSQEQNLFISRVECVDVSLLRRYNVLSPKTLLTVVNFGHRPYIFNSACTDKGNMYRRSGKADWARRRTIIPPGEHSKGANDCPSEHMPPEYPHPEADRAVYKRGRRTESTLSLADR